MSIIEKQKTAHVAFDKYQKVIAKKNQTAHKSSTVHTGTMYLGIPKHSAVTTHNGGQWHTGHYLGRAPDGLGFDSQEVHCHSSGVHLVGGSVPQPSGWGRNVSPKGKISQTVQKKVAANL
jgi:hypothetical protein